MRAGELQKADEAAAEAESSETGARAPSEKGGKEETRKHRKKKPNAFSRLYDEAGEVRRRHEERVMAAEREREEAIQRSRPSAKPNKSNLATSSRAEPRGDHLVDRLYRQGIQQRAIRTLEYEAARAAREEQLMSEYTFKPTISSRALEGTQKSTGWQRLWDNAQSRQAALQERQRQRQEEKAAKEAAACKFKPSIGACQGVSPPRPCLQHPLFGPLASFPASF